MLDIEVAGAIAPQATIAAYFAPNTDRGFIDGLLAAMHDKTHRPSVVSISWGSPESGWTQQATNGLNQALQDAGLLGITVCVAAGDGGSADGAGDGLAHADFPASSPFALACGGTRLEVKGATPGATETVWNDGPDGGATGGGVSDIFAVPAWQKDAHVPKSVNPGHTVGRGLPDVACFGRSESDPLGRLETDPPQVGFPAYRFLTCCCRRPVGFACGKVSSGLGSSFRGGPWLPAGATIST